LEVARSVLPIPKQRNSGRWPSYNTGAWEPVSSRREAKVRAVLPQLIAGSFPRWSVSFPQGPPARGCCFALIDGWIPSSAPSLEDSRFGWSSFGRAGQGQPHLQFGGAATLLPPRIFSVRAVQDHPEQHHLGIGLQRRDQVVEVAADLVWLGILGSPRAGASLLRRPRSSPRRLLASRSCTGGGSHFRRIRQSERRGDPGKATRPGASGAPKAPG